MGLFSKSKEKLQAGLSATKTAWTQRLKKAVLGRSSVDADFIEELEEVLLMSDVGVTTTQKIIERLENRVAKDKYLNVSELDKLLYDEMVDLLTTAETNEKRTTSELHVVLVVGVNGAGKTTTIGKLAHRYKNEEKK